ncbi:MAG TPA: rod shape-determining protein MreD [Ardenticatenaceae bacterium]|nr:rod shape-determining protein MreD [Ardenticatenaceae bacterium]
MNLYLPVVVLTIAALIQVTLLPRVSVADVHLELVFLLAIAWSLLRGPVQGVVWGFVGGLLLDLFSAAPFGVFTLALMFVASASGIGESAVFRQNLLLPLGTALVGTLLFHLVTLVLLWTLGWPLDWNAELFRIILATMVLNTVCMPFVFGSARQLSQAWG